MEVKLHDIGEGMAEAGINCFLVKPGDFVKADDPLLEVQTDKMTAEIPSPAAGIVKEFKVNPGDTVPVGTTLLILEASATLGRQPEKVAAIPEYKKGGAEVEGPSSVNGTSQVKPIFPRILASPYTRKIAREHGIRLEDVTGTGPAGRIMDTDVYNFLENLTTNDSQQQTGLTEAEPKIDQPQTVKPVPFRGRRRQIAKNMLHSIQTIPHCTHFEEIDVTNLIEFRKELKASNIQLSATAIFIKTLSVCLKEFPIFNAILDEENEVINLNDHHHIGTAVDTEDGLIVPVIRNVQAKSLTEIHSEMKALTEKALRNQLTIKDIQGGTFTVSNVGPLGGSIGATPIIQHPQVALVSFHKTKKMPVVNERDEIEIRSIMNLSMSFDHRVADGASAVKFTNKFAAYIANPQLLLLELV
ncbi:dihydrolipoyllysine acetyltransferase [Bacillus sp. FJAT-27225]|uniref:dihydrolipoamide acetyltransferase family protein n=1 Tax=Bacillus sp. FJAT-27225 TaxID=1743144 RepID=UPI00080C2753|nr:dihydrolipoamide acetyltransferase family protein [Bacillus sp. FJAT-27225]OCA90649.1 dihydrolipoyllysine acetyltransferase [Bacillus sp. FJAT-27225]